MLELTQPMQRFRFVNVPEAPLPSLLRNFSAPVIVDYRYSDSELMFLMVSDSDAFNRWEAGQRLATMRLMQLTDAVEAGRTAELDDDFVTAMRATLQDPSLSPAFKEPALTLPAEGFLGEQRAVVNPQAIRTAHRLVFRELGRRLAGDWQRTFEAHATPGEYSPAPGPGWLGHRCALPQAPWPIFFDRSLVFVAPMV